MRLFYLLVLLSLLFLLLMPLQKCEGCSESYTNLPNHVKSCLWMRRFLAGGLKNRVDQTSRANAERLAELERVREEEVRIRAEALLRETEARAREEVHPSARLMRDVPY